jgi:hypothetical protein
LVRNAFAALQHSPVRVPARCWRAFNSADLNRQSLQRSGLGSLRTPLGAQASTIVRDVPLARYVFGNKLNESANYQTQCSTAN